MGHLEEDLKAVPIKFEGWRGAAQKASRWFPRVEDEVEAFLMRKRHDAEGSITTVQHTTVATATQAVDTNARRGEGDPAQRG